MKQLVCLSYTPWQKSPTRTQQLLTRLRDADILFIEPPATGANKSYRRPGRKVRPNVTVYTLPPLLGGQSEWRFFRRRNQARLSAFLLKILAKHRFREPVLWTTTPENLFLVESLPHRGLVYDCDREWDELPLEWESELAALADVTFAASSGLAERLAPCCDNIALLPNGVNHLMFSRPDLEPPALLKTCPGPVLGRVGRIAEDTDLEPLLYAAAARPDWTFLLIGPISSGASRRLSRLPNLLCTGTLPASDVPDYLAGCQVCFDLLARNSRGSDILPPHFYEYLSTGKPVVLMLDHDQVEPYPDVIYTAHTPSGFLKRCQRALEEDPTWVSGRRREYAVNAQWSFRAREIDRILETTGLI